MTRTEAILYRTYHLPPGTCAAAKEHAANYYCDGEPSAKLQAIMALTESTSEDDWDTAEDMLIDLIAEDMASE